MDPQEHHHDPTENDLKEFLTNFGDFWAKHGNTILLVVVVLLALIVGYNWWSSRTAAAHTAAWSALAQAQTPEQLQTVAERHSDQAVQTLARLRAADLYVEQAVEGAPPQPVEQTPAEGEGEGQAAPQPQTLDPAAALEEAHALYQQVVEQASDPVYRANALLGLATVAESRQQWDQAAQHYQQAAELAEQHELPAIAGQAERRQALLEDLRTPVVFAPEPPAQEQGEGPSAGGGAGAGAGSTPNLLPTPGAAAPATGGAPPQQAAPQEGAPAQAQPAAGGGATPEPQPEPQPAGE